MKKVILIVLTIMCLVFTSCSVFISRETSETPTGYPVEQLQREFVFFNGKVYVYADSCLASLPEHYVKVGVVQSVDNVNLPTSDYQAAHLEIGNEIYTFKGTETSTDMYIIVKRSHDRFEKFVVFYG